MMFAIFAFYSTLDLESVLKDQGITYLNPQIQKRGTAFLTALLMKTLLEVIIAFVAVAGLVVLFVCSARSTRAGPSGGTSSAATMAGWCAALDAGCGDTSIVNVRETRRPP